MMPVGPAQETPTDSGVPYSAGKEKPPGASNRGLTCPKYPLTVAGASICRNLRSPAMGAGPGCVSTNNPAELLVTEPSELLTVTVKLEPLSVCAVGAVL